METWRELYLVGYHRNSYYELDNSLCDFYFENFLFLMYCKLGNVLEGLIFANICESDASQIQGSC